MINRISIIGLIVFAAGCKNAITTPADMIRSDDSASLSKLLSSGLDVNTTLDRSQMSLLHIAAAQGSMKCLRVLIDHGSNKESVDRAGLTPLHYAIVNKRGDAVKLLVEKGANVRATTNNGNAAFDLAKEEGLSELLPFLK